MLNDENFINIAKHRSRKTKEEGIADKLKKRVPVSRKVIRASYIPMLKFIARNNSKKFVNLIAQFEFDADEVEYLSNLKPKEIKKLVNVAQEIRGKELAKSMDIITSSVVGAKEINSRNNQESQLPRSERSQTRLFDF